jgi:hypothetical protein
MAYVSAYGNYGQEAVLVFDTNDLHHTQWDTLGELGDSDKLSYVLAILNNESTEKWEDA